MAYKRWVPEDAFSLMRAIDTRLSGVGFHVAMCGARQLNPLELVVYPCVNAIDREAIRLLVQQEPNLKRLGKDTLKRPKKFGEMRLKEIESWVHGRGHNARRVDLLLQSV